MIPLRDNVPTRRFPIVTVLLIAANVAVFLADQATGHVELSLVRTPEGYLQVRQFVGGLSQAYAMVPSAVTHDLSANWSTVFTSMFLHANWLHIIGNMLYLWIFGNNIEDTLGRGRFLVFYFVCGAAAAAAHIYTGPDSTAPTVGASGAIAGVLGAYLILFPGAEILSIVPVCGFGALVEVPAILVIGLWAVLQFVNANWLGGGEVLHGGGVAYFAHVGGFVAGMIIILLLGGRRLLSARAGPHVDDRSRDDRDDTYYEDRY